MTAPSDEELRRARKEQRRALKTAHPFGVSLPHPEPLDLYVEAGDGPAFAAFSGRELLLGGCPPVSVFEQVTELGLRRVFVRNVVLQGLHPLGGSLDEVAASVRDTIVVPEQSVFFGTSMGGYLALVLATLLGVPAVVVVNPTTTLDKEFRDGAGDERWPELTPHLTPELLGSYADLASRWSAGGTRPHVDVHFSYRNEVNRSQAEHVADLDNVTLHPYYEYLPLPVMLADGTLRRQVAAARERAG